MVVRLTVAVLVAAIGAVLVLGGLVNLGRPSSTGEPGTSALAAGTTTAPPAGSPAGTAATAGTGAPGTSASPGTPPSPGASASPGTSPSPPARATPTTPPPGEPVLVGAGDIGRCDSTDDEATAALAEKIPGTVFTLGDNAYDTGTPAEFRNCYGPGWGRFLDRTGFAVAGNHDYGTPGASGFTAYFGTAAVRGGVTWFSQDVGTWHVIVLDGNCAELRGGCGADSPQLAWLRRDLAASDGRCTLALWHQPRFSSGEHGDDASVGPFWDVLYAAGADLVLNGHDHDYERFAPQDPEGRADPARGISEIVAGTGGAALRAFAHDAPNTIVRSSLVHGVLVLTLGQSGWGFRFVSTDGSFSDQGRGTCH